MLNIVNTLCFVCGIWFYITNRKQCTVVPKLKIRQKNLLPVILHIKPISNIGMQLLEEEPPDIKGIFMGFSVYLLF